MEENWGRGGVGPLDGEEGGGLDKDEWYFTQGFECLSFMYRVEGWSLMWLTSVEPSLT